MFSAAEFRSLDGAAGRCVRVTTDRGQSGREMSAFWWTHSAPIGPLTPHHAHAIMQMHLECRVEDCARKSAAFRALVEAGRIKPDSGCGAEAPASRRAIDSNP